MNDTIRAIFDSNGVGSLATINSDGSPWASPIHVAYDDEYVYWLSSAAAQHSQNIEQDARVSLSLWSPDESEGIKGVFVQSAAQQIEGDDGTKARAVFERRFGVVPAALVAAATYRAPLGQVSTDKSFGNCWYFYN